MDARTIVVVAAVIGCGPRPLSVAGQGTERSVVRDDVPSAVGLTSTLTCQSCSSSGIVSDAECQRGELLAGGFLLAFDDQLSARRANVSAAALAHGYGHVMIGEDL